MFKEPEYKLQGSLDPPPIPIDTEGGLTGTMRRVFDPSGGGNREKGLSLKATTGRTGKGNDATFNKFISLHEGDKFIDPKRIELMANVEKRKHNVSETPFKASSPMKKSVAAGDYYGTIGGRVSHEPETIIVPKKKGEIPEKPKGIYTNPPKKGSFGMNKFTLSERQGYKGVATEYEYQHDPTDAHKDQRMAGIEAHHKACVSELPFKPSNPAKKGGAGVPNTTISKGKGVAGEWEYILSPEPKVEGGIKKEDPIPFKMANAHVAKRINHIEYIHDPEEPKIEKEHARKIDESKKIAVTGAWRPNRGNKTDMVRSIVKMNIPRC